MNFSFQWSHVFLLLFFKCVWLLFLISVGLFGSCHNCSFTLIFSLSIPPSVGGWGNSLRSWTGTTRAGGWLATNMSTPNQSFHSSLWWMLIGQSVAAGGMWRWNKIQMSSKSMSHPCQECAPTFTSTHIHTPRLHTSHTLSLSVSLLCSH